jgi:mono/diheme cytochrome c family protein
MISVKALAAIAAGAFLVFTCPYLVAAHDRITTKVTWTREIAPIFEARCASCHRGGGRSTIPLETYQQARPWAAAIKEEVLTRRMPRWYAARGYGDFANDPSLSPFEIALIAAWVDGGAPEIEKGKPATGAVPAGWLTVASFTPPPPSKLRTVSERCGERAVAGKLIAIRPSLELKGSAGIAAVLPSGRQEVIAWIRDYDPHDAVTYWLRTPIMLPTGSRLRVDSAGGCSIDLTFAR